MPKVLLTDKFLQTHLSCPDGKRRTEYCDTRIPGLYIEVRSSSPGGGTYYLRYKDATGKTCHKKIGRTDEISLANARNQAKTLKAEIQLGADPCAEARRRKEVPNWNTFFTDLYLPYARQHKRSWKGDQVMHRHYISDEFGRLPINRFRKDAVVAFHNRLRESGLAPATADHYVKLIRRALNLAVEWDMIPTNPVARITLFNADNRIERFLSQEELQKLLHTLDTVDARRRTVAMVVKFLLFTGARVDEALQARWADIDRKNRTWTIQAANSKSKRRRSIPLNDAAMAILDQLRTRNRSEWLFTSSRKARDGSGGRERMTSINKVWQQIRVDAGLPTLRLHDLRHNYASMLVNSGRTLYEVQQILGHSDSKVTERYAHLSTATLQDAANSAGEYVKQVTGK
ncbi:DUF4102 domain-containing protein [Seongchinamella unica]|uniref:DUF4102 domain-containing protein n=1 Tax=Seongchinamella unica TaxID=2547392 RepID=A0A4R5LN92_9GAMM|nr:site-specific integrase [Seongchinamella unica]TDG11658.1 DUF4102 domain-containing protein [Seongchinamella unica]